MSMTDEMNKKVCRTRQRHCQFPFSGCMRSQDVTSDKRKTCSRINDPVTNRQGVMIARDEWGQGDHPNEEGGCGETISNHILNKRPYSKIVLLNLNPQSKRNPYQIPNFQSLIQTPTSAQGLRTPYPNPYPIGCLPLQRKTLLP